MTRTEVVFSLISHTNIGKTTLARTLLRRDIGEVRDGAHVTGESTRYPMIETEDAVLVIWDTPGFGNVTKLLKRLEQEGGAWGWLVREVVDRVFNRPLFCSVEAARNVRELADVVLYLVNVREAPEDAGYVPLELKLIQALGKPVIMILNQLRVDQFAEPAQRKELRQKWQDHFRTFPGVKAVLVLDAFTRSANGELMVLDAALPWLSLEKAEALKRLRAEWLLHRDQVIGKCAEAVTRVLLFAVRQAAVPSENASHKDHFQSMIAGLQNELDIYMEVLVSAHGIQSEGRVRFQTDINHVAGLTAQKVSEEKTGLLAAAIGSAGSGLMADILSGGLTLGGGALLGFLGGYLGGISYAKVMNLRKRGKVAWRDDALILLFKLTVTYYLLAAHHGRGKGRLPLDEPAAFLTQTVDRIWPEAEEDVRDLVKEARLADPGPDEAAFYVTCESVFRQIAGSAMNRLYPGQDG